MLKPLPVVIGQFGEHRPAAGRHLVARVHGDLVVGGQV